MPVLRKQKSTEEIRRRKGVDAFVKSLGASAVEYGKGRLRDYPKEVVSGWKTALGMTPRVVPESLEGIEPVAESVGGLAVTIPQALKQLGRSAVKLRPKSMYFSDMPGKFFRSPRDWKISAGDVRGMAEAIRRSPEKLFEHSTSIKYKGDLGRSLGQNVRDYDKFSAIELAPSAGAKTLYHEGIHTTAHAARGEKTLQGYLSDLLETSTEIARKGVHKAKQAGKISKGKQYYQDAPIEQHARLATWALPRGTKISRGTYDEIFNKSAMVILSELKKDWPKLHKQTLKEVAKEYKVRADIKRRMESGGMPETFDEWMAGIVTSPKSKVTKPSLPMKTEDIIKLIKKLPKGETKKIKIKRKAD